MAEVLLYGSIDSYSSSQFIIDINAVDGEDLVVRVNTDGGSPEFGWGMIAKFSEFKGSKKVKVDGKAYSMGLYYCCYTDDVECLDVSEFILHRAAYPEWIESNPEYFDQPMRENLERINKNLQSAFENKVDVEKFEQLTGKKLKDVFSMDTRIDVPISSKVAKKIGLVNTITNITPSKKAEIDSKIFAIAAKYNGGSVAANTNQITDKKPNTNKMTIAEFKTQHPAIYAEVFALGVAKEKDRVEACLTFIEIDAKGVKAAIESGKDLSAKQMADFALKSFGADALKGIAEANAAVVDTGADAATATDAEKKKAAAKASLEKLLGVKI